MKRLHEINILMVAIIYGFGYSIQAIGTNYFSTFYFNGLKYLLAFLSILPLALKKDETDKRKTFFCGFVLALIISLFAFIQQSVAGKSAPGKVGFITAMYIVEVPLINIIFFKQKISKRIILSLSLAVLGLVLLCDLSNFSLNLYDLLAIVGSFCLALQIIFVEKKCQEINTLKMNAVIFFFVATFNFISVLIAKEDFANQNLAQGFWVILYQGLLASSLSCSLQFIAQKYVDSTTSSLILSLESLFSVIGGFIVLHNILSLKELIGCLAMFIAVLICVSKK